MTRPRSPELTKAWRRLPGRGHAVSFWRTADRSDPGDESGAVIILALIFLVAVSLVVTALLSWVGASLKATGAFNDERSVEYAATSAVNLAIQNTRYYFDAPDQPNNTSAAPMLNAVQPVPCWGPGTMQAVDGVQINVWCTMIWQPYSSQTRTITFSACLSTVTTGAQCGQTPLLQAVIAFDDYPAGLALPAAPTQCTPYSKNGDCGESQTQISWQWNPLVPEVTSLAPNNGSPSPPATIQLSGSGFVPGMTANFVQESGDAATSSNITFLQQATSNVSCSGADLTNCVASVTVPSVTEGNDYFVTVATPGGTSAAEAGAENSGNYIVFAYDAPPQLDLTVTSLAGTTSGSIAGGASVTVNGTGFYASGAEGVQVWFCPQAVAASSCETLGSGGVQANPLLVNVLSESQLTVVSPQVSTTGSYYIQVETVSGYSMQTTDDFSYSVQVPIIISLSTTPATGGTGYAAKGPSGTSVTISGYNFVPGSTVCWQEDVGGNPSGTCTNSSSVTYQSESSMAAVVPTLTNNENYFPVITDPSSYGTPASQPYNEPADIFAYTT